MNDDDVLRALSGELNRARQSLDYAGRRTLVAEILSRGRVRRWRRGLTAGYTGAVVLGAALMLAVGAPAHTAGTSGPQVAPWTVRHNPDGTVTLTVRQMPDPVALHAALFRAGVPTIVTLDSSQCHVTGRPWTRYIPPTAGTLEGETVISNRAWSVSGPAVGNVVTFRPVALSGGAQYVVGIELVRTEPGAGPRVVVGSALPSDPSLRCSLSK